MKKDTEGWIELTGKGPRAGAPLVTALLVEAGSGGVIEEEPPSNDNDSDGLLLKAYIKSCGEKDQKELRKKLSLLGWSLSSRPYREVDWSKRWMEGLKPVRVALSGSKESFLVKPTWIELKGVGAELVVDMDPGMAFGVGSHPSTKGCLKALLFANSKKKLKSVLDVGTGTGVLAIAAKKLGAVKVVGTDNDPLAIKIARKNAQLNNAEITLSTKPVEKVRGGFEVVVANILSHVLIGMLAELYNKTAKDGLVILSGILTEEVSTVRSAAAKAGLSPAKTFHLSGRGLGGGSWVTLVYKKGS